MNKIGPERQIGAAPGSFTGQTSAFSLRDATATLFRHKWKIMPFAIATIGAVWFHTASVPDTYTSEARLLLRQGWESAALDPVTMAGRATPMRTEWVQAINSELEILRSRPVFEQTVERLGADALLPPERTSRYGAFKQRVRNMLGMQRVVAQTEASPQSRFVHAMLTLHAGIEIGSVADSHVISVSCTLHDPELAREALATLLEVFESQRVATYSRPGTLVFLEEQTQALHASLVEADDRIRTIKNELGISSIDAQRLDISAHLNELRTAASKLNRELAGGKRRMADLQAADEATSRRLSPTAYREHQATVQSEAMQLRSREAEMEVLKPQIVAAREALRQLNDNEVTLSDLERQRAILNARYLQYSQNLEQARIEQTLERDKLSSLSVIQPPTRPIGGQRSQMRLMLMLAAMLGIGGGVGIAFMSEYFDQTVRKPDDVQDSIGIPLLLSFPRLKRRHVIPRLRRGHDQDTGEPRLLKLPNRASEYVDALGHRIQTAMAGSTQRPAVIGLTSCKPGEGVSILAINLAASLAGCGSAAKRTLLIEPYAWREPILPFQGRRQGYRAMEFFPDPNDGAIRVFERNLYKLDDNLPTAGGPSAVESSELVDMARASDVDFVLFDLPPLSAGVAGERLAAIMDTIVLVVESERIRLHTVRDACRRFSSSGANLLGAILNKRRYYVPEWLYQKL